MNVQVQHDINVRRIVIWPFTNPKTEICGAAHEFGERAKSASWSINANTQYVNSDGVTVGSYTGTPRGNGTLGLSGFTAGEREMLFSNKATDLAFGSTDSSAVEKIEIVNVGKRDVAPYVRLAFITDCDDGYVNLYKFLRVQFSPYEKTVDQVNDSGQVTFSTISVPFAFFDTFSQSENIEGKYYEALHVDPTSERGAAFIANWMADGDYVGQGLGLYGMYSIKVDSTSIRPGGSIASGSTVSLEGSADGGTFPYKYSFYYKADGSDSWTALSEDSTTSAATVTLSVTADTLYSFKFGVKDANGVVVNKVIQVTVTAPSN